MKIIPLFRFALIYREQIGGWRGR